jgi:hypothetical protein
VAIIIRLLVPVKAMARPLIGGGCIIYGMVGNEGRVELDKGVELLSARRTAR